MPEYGALRRDQCRGPEPGSVLGEPVDVVGISVAWHLDDVPFIECVSGVPN
jgi:hypothetical protein